MSCIFKDWKSISAVFIAILLSPGDISATTFYVSTNGTPDASGTISDPLPSIQAAAEIMQTGDECQIRGGTYSETVRPLRSGTPGNPICFRSYSNETVVIDGTEIVEGPWENVSNQIYRTSVATNFEQLFVDQKMMLEARWPNMPFKENWHPEKKWSPTDAQSVLGELHSQAMAESGIDFSGALAYLKLGKQNTMQTRTVTNHSAGSDSFTYATNGLSLDHIENYGYVDNRFFLLGVLPALDCPGEWYLNRTNQLLYLWTPDGSSPSNYSVTVKARKQGFLAEERSHLEIKDLDFFGCNLELLDCNDCLVDGCNFSYPSMQRDFEIIGDRESHHPVYLNGSSIEFRNCQLNNCVREGLSIWGSDIEAKNCLVSNVNWHGIHPEAAIQSTHRGRAGANRITHCTTAHNGGVGIRINAGPQIVSFNDIFHNGIYTSDISAFYLPYGATAGGSIIHHNWSHNNPGKGYRCDVKGTNITVHHNLAWGNNQGNKWQGWNFKIYNETVAVDYENAGLMMVFERDLPANHLLFNNAAYRIHDRDHERTPTHLDLLPSPTISNNFILEKIPLERYFAHPAQADFRPALGSPLIDSGRIIPGINDDYLGMAPDIGAYERGATNYWIPGRKLNRASKPIPANGAKMVKADLELIWREGRGAKLHDVYYGTHSNAVANATTNSPEYAGRQANNIYDPNGILGQPCFWRIDEITTNDLVLKGAVWKFEARSKPSLMTNEFLAGDDSWILDGNPENHSDEDHLRVRAKSRYSYLKFVIDDLRGKRIKSVKLCLKSKAEINDTSVHRVSATNWSEENLSGTNEPPRGEILNTVSNITRDIWYEFDLSTFITNQGEWSVALSTTHNDSGKDWHSKESSSPPKLIVTYLPEEDLDGDGISDYWELDYFGATNRLDGAANADMDADGMTNYEEYITGTNPLDYNSIFRASQTKHASKFSLHFQSQSDRIYAIERCPTLSSNTWSLFASNIIGNGTLTNISDLSPSDRRYYRIRIRKAP